ncbi:hypothetical protein [Marinobacterium sp. BA1]|uniref:hypothetical protein n=1 Tax=Marinobacterium sp. BA1 TaxID=3138931 RepID=UPI0032E66B34
MQVAFINIGVCLKGTRPTLTIVNLLLKISQPITDNVIGRQCSLLILGFFLFGSFRIYTGIKLAAISEALAFA